LKLKKILKKKQELTHGMYGSNMLTI